MFKIIFAALFISTSSFAGIGGIAGGHIHFQEDSTWVNALFSRSLCHNESEYKAIVRKCSHWDKSDDNRKCEKFEKTEIYQPMQSTRKRCKKREDKRCIEWETVDFYQDPNRVIKIYDDDGDLKQVKEVKIPVCN